MDKKYRLQEHQERVKQKAEQQGAVLAFHGLGSGKTLAALASRDGKTTMVTPASLRSNATDTVVKFGLPSDNLKVISYEGATKHKPKGNTLIVDEVHRIGDSTTKRSQAIRDMAKDYKRIVLLSGSPIKNRPHELAPIAQALHFGEAKLPLSPKEFKAKFIHEKVTTPSLFASLLKGEKPKVELSVKNKKKLQQVFKGRVDYHVPSKENYPAVIESVVNVPMSKTQAKEYRKAEQELDGGVKYKIRNGIPLTSSEAAGSNAFLNKTRIISNTAEPFGGEPNPPKIKHITSAIKSSQDKNKRWKDMVYSNYLDGGVKALSRELKKKKIKHYVFHGGLNDKEKKKIVDKYNKATKGTLLISGAGAEGLDLKGTRGVHIMEPHWNSTRIDQAIGRAARFKSHEHLPQKERNVKVTRYLSSQPHREGLSKWIFGKKDKNKTADEHLLELSKKKDKLNNAFLDILKQS